MTSPASYPAGSHILRVAQSELRVHGAYLYEASPPVQGLRLRRPCVFVAEADSAEEARELHRRIWNLGTAPFLIVLLPSQVRVYAGFQFASRDRHLGLLLEDVPLDAVAKLIERFGRESIDSGSVWHRERQALDYSRRVDRRLLESLKDLGHRLRTEYEVPPETAHNLIGKYIYIYYLRDRAILSNDWLLGVGVDPDSVFGDRANASGLRRLVDALEGRFNGNVFPLTFSGVGAASDEAVRFTASVFSGDEPSGQLSLDFHDYDFSFIPIELLSSIYEQFLHAEGKGREEGAYYTPEPLAEYVAGEVEAECPLTSDSKILDPACGSGVFLVICYRRLIEAALRASSRDRLTPSELRQILERSIFGVERSHDACRVAEFSLILTLLSYIEPPELHRNQRFRFPTLHGKNIFAADFFDESSPFNRMEGTFDWIVGNPPWKELKPDERAGSERFAAQWMERNGLIAKIARWRVGDAFLVRARDFLSEKGVAGLLVQATTLVNLQLQAFRSAFFTSTQVLRVTNLASLAYRLFSANTPAASVVYKHRAPGVRRYSILHTGPLVARQPVLRETKSHGAWALTINDGDIQSVDSAEAESGEGIVWKMALWGSPRDRLVLERVGRTCTPLGEVALKHDWTLSLGLQLRSKGEGKDRMEEVVGMPVLDHNRLGGATALLAVPDDAFRPIGDRVFARGSRRAGLPLIRAPHLWIKFGFAAYSDKDFVIEHSEIGLSASRGDEDKLRALSVYLGSSLGRYLAFFFSTSTGVDRTLLILTDVRSLPVPELTGPIGKRLAEIHRELAVQDPEISVESQRVIDEAVFAVMGFPRELRISVSDFVRTNLRLIKGKTGGAWSAGMPDDRLLREYGETLKATLERFAGTPHAVRIVKGGDFVAARITLPDDPELSTVEIAPDPLESRVLLNSLRARHSQWTYVHRSLRVFADPDIWVIKAPRALEWTVRAALDDADDVIAEVLSVTPNLA